MKSLYKIFHSPKQMAILIIVCYILGVTIGLIAEEFRISDYRWVYEIGKMISLFLSIGAIIWSFFHPLIVWSIKRKKWKEYLFWIIVGMLPFLYMITMMIILNFKFGDKPSFI